MKMTPALERLQARLPGLFTVEPDAGVKACDLLIARIREDLKAAQVVRASHRAKIARSPEKRMLAEYKAAGIDPMLAPVQYLKDDDTIAPQNHPEPRQHSDDEEDEFMRDLAGWDAARTDGQDAYGQDT